MGLGMLIIGGFFTVWWRLRPLRHEQPDKPPPYQTGTGQ
jgi:hypothetical protein